MPSSSSILPTPPFKTEAGFLHRIILIGALTSSTLLSGPGMGVASAADVIVGDDPGKFRLGWTDGVCYRPIRNVMPGDTLTFNYFGHDVHRMADRSHLDSCNFTGSTELGGVARGPYTYEVTDEDYADGEGELYFACKIGSHCSSGPQRLVVRMRPAEEAAVVERRDDDAGTNPVSKFSLGKNGEECFSVWDTDDDGDDDDDEEFRSTCTEPVLAADGRHHEVSCLSSRVTLTPGGVINQLRLLHYPYPKDRRVVAGQRTWEFVSGDPDPVDGVSGGGVVPVPHNQLYIHHIAGGGVIMGNGNEGIRRAPADAPFPEPYGLLTGDGDDVMIFHLIDLREVPDDEWIACVECRCRGDDEEIITSNTTTGGIACCHNCTELVGPTVDYRMRYNVSYRHLDEDDEPVTEVLGMFADISPAVGKFIEFDVPKYTDLGEGEKKESNPMIQRLVREGPFNTIFFGGFGGAPSHGDGSEELRILRCVHHLHIAALGMWIEDVTTGRNICEGLPTYGTDPDEDKGILTAITVQDFDDGANVIRADTPVRIVTEYDATTVHTGVMGLFFVFVAGEQQVGHDEADLLVDVCTLPTCDASLLPNDPQDSELVQECVDVLPESPPCLYGGLCDCDEFINHTDSTGCGGVFTTELGSIEVDSMCAETCGCASSPRAAGGGCEDALPNHFLCLIAGMCDCEEFVALPESTGCGGVYKSDNANVGDIDIDEVCGSYCDACPDRSSDEAKMDIILERIEYALQLQCRYATEECRNALFNLYSCAKEKSGVEGLDPLVRNVTVAHGRRLALKHAKLGSEFNHRGVEQDQTVGPCQTEEPTAGVGAADDSSAFSWFSLHRICYVIVLASACLLW